MQTITLSIRGMTCGHCVASVRGSLEAVPGAVVQDVRVGSAEIALDPATLPAAVLTAVGEAGYDAEVAGATAADSAATASCACCTPAPASLARSGRARRAGCH
jgi:copper chaperone CopZ